MDERENFTESSGRLLHGVCDYNYTNGSRVGCAHPARCSPSEWCAPCW